MHMQWDAVKTEDDIYQYLCMNLHPLVGYKGSMMEIDPDDSMLLWEPILEYDNNGLDHTLYKCEGHGFCFDVRDVANGTDRTIFPNQGASSTWPGLMDTLVQKYRHDIVM